MSPFTLVALFAAIFLVKGAEEDCTRTGVYGEQITPVDLSKENVVTFNTNDVPWDPIQLYAGDFHELDLFLHVFTDTLTDGDMYFMFQHSWPTGCGEDDVHEACDESIPDNTFPHMRFCAGKPYKLASPEDPMLSIQIQQEGNFLVLKRDGEFVGKAALPYKDCDPTKPRSVIDGVTLPWGPTTWQPNPC